MEERRKKEKKERQTYRSLGLALLGSNRVYLEEINCMDMLIHMLESVHIPLCLISTFFLIRLHTAEPPYVTGTVHQSYLLFFTEISLKENCCCSCCCSVPQLNTPRVTQYVHPTPVHVESIWKD